VWVAGLDDLFALVAGAAAWDAGGVRDDVRACAAPHLGSADGVLVVDETGFLKKSI
jgi:SRSO17 transposase